MACEEISALERKAAEIRRGIIETAYFSGRLTHPGPALSITDICTALYYKFMKVDPANPGWDDRDRFILSKGHACLAPYVILADQGFFPKAELKTVRHLDSILQGHPVLGKTPGIDMTTGSLGNGLGIGLGMAYYLKLQGKASKVFVMIGDGELNEGTIWEAVLEAPALRADNLIAIVDQNHFQSCGSTEDIQPMQNLRDRWEVFGWKTFEINGHDMQEIVSRLEIAVNHRGAPICIVANTVKGKGVSFMEHDNAWHQKMVAQDDYDKAIAGFSEAAK
jgi:transketolase